MPRVAAKPTVEARLDALERKARRLSKLTEGIRKDMGELGRKSWLDALTAAIQRTAEDACKERLKAAECEATQRAQAAIEENTLARDAIYESFRSLGMSGGNALDPRDWGKLPHRIKGLMRSLERMTPVVKTARRLAHEEGPDPFRELKGAVEDMEHEEEANHDPR